MSIIMNKKVKKNQIKSFKEFMNLRNLLGFSKCNKLCNTIELIFEK